MAAPGRPVWALVGDGTYLMMPTEIVTAVQEDIPIKVVIVAEPRVRLHRRPLGVGRRRAASAPPTATAAADGTYTGAPLPVDLAANAASLGMRVLRAKTVRDLRDALAEARAADTSHMCLRRDPKRPTQCRARLPAQAWWDVPVAETATRPSAVKAREEYDRHVAARRRHL